MTDKETLSDKIKIGYELDYAIETKDVRGFINDLKEGTNRVIKTYTYSEMYREMHKLIYKLAGPKLANHSPHENSSNSIPSREHEDTQTLCECGHRREEHRIYNNDCFICDCLKFKQRKGCGKHYCLECGNSNEGSGIFEHKQGCEYGAHGVVVCGECGSCSACSGAGE